MAPAIASVTRTAPIGKPAGERLRERQHVRLDADLS